MPNAEDAATLQAYAEGVFAARRELETKWGVGRAELLAGDDLRAKWRRQCVTWREALESAWAAPFLSRDLLDAVTAKAAAMKRGCAALDAACEEAGHRPIAPWVWEAPLNDGTVAAIVQTNAEAGHVIASGRYLAVYTLAEVANVIMALPDALKLAKQLMPGSRFQAPALVDHLGAGPWNPDGDPLPFPFEAREQIEAEQPQPEPLEADEWA